MNRKLNFAIIGLGRAGSIHFKNLFLSNACSIKYALDIDEDKLKIFKFEYHDSNIKFILSDNYFNILDDSDLDAVVITTPTDFHESEILHALEKGKSVFCEKPISKSVESIRTLYKLASEKNLILHCSLNRRYDPSLQQINQAILNNELGRIHLIKTTSRDFPKPPVDYLKISGGIFHDCGIHDLDIVCWLLKRKPVTVYVTSFTGDPEIKSINDSETVVISLTFDDGTLAVIDLSRQSAYGYDQRVEVHGDRGVMESLNQRPSNVHWSTANGTLIPPLMDSFAVRYRESYNNSLNDFINCVLERKPSPVKGEEIILLSQLATACGESCKSHQIVKLL